jgi:hypothetical protein
MVDGESAKYADRVCTFLKVPEKETESTYRRRYLKGAEYG